MSVTHGVLECELHGGLAEGPFFEAPVHSALLRLAGSEEGNLPAKTRTANSDPRDRIRDASVKVRDNLEGD